MKVVISLIFSDKGAHLERLQIFQLNDGSRDRRASGFRDRTRHGALSWSLLFLRSGRIRVGGQQVETLSETGVARFRRRQVGMVFQFFNLLDDLTVMDNVLLPAQLAGVRTSEARSRADELLVTLRIAHRQDAYPARLSGGERQRVAIARAMVNRPAVLLADEPTGAVDSSTGAEIGALLLELNSAGQTLILVTHNPELAARYTQRVIELADGRVREQTTAARR